MPMYRPSEAVETIILRKPVDTATVLELRGSDDGFASDRREFSTEEDIRLNGTVTATDGSDLSAAIVEIYLDGALVGTAALSYDPALLTNLYLYSLGVLGGEDRSIEIRVKFEKYRTFAASSATVRISFGIGWWEQLKAAWDKLPLWQKILIASSCVAGAGAAIYQVTQ